MARGDSESPVKKSSGTPAAEKKGSAPKKEEKPGGPDIRNFVSLASPSHSRDVLHTSIGLISQFSQPAASSSGVSETRPLRMRGAIC